MLLDILNKQHRISKSTLENWIINGKPKCIVYGCKKNLLL